jgi:hypothetical protein
LLIGSQDKHELAAALVDLSFESGVTGESAQAIQQPLGRLIGILKAWAPRYDFATTLSLQTLH